MASFGSVYVCVSVCVYTPFVCAAGGVGGGKRARRRSRAGNYTPIDATFQPDMNSVTSNGSVEWEIFQKYKIERRIYLLKIMLITNIGNRTHTPNANCCCSFLRNLTQTAAAVGQVRNQTAVGNIVECIPLMFGPLPNSC